MNYQELIAQISDLEQKLAFVDPSSEEFVEIAQEYSKLKQVSTAYENLFKSQKQLAELTSMPVEEGYEELIEQERVQLESLIATQQKEYDLLTLEPLPNDNRATIIEVRAGSGGTEASLFAEELMRMYTRYSNEQGWTVEVIDINYETEGGIKSAVLEIKDKGSYGRLRFESGVHRVQRVPVTESAGRIHTSAASVAVLPLIERKDVEINDSDLKIDVYRSSGPGGQSVNTTDSAVRITHIPSGIVVTCQDQKSQLKNKDKAMTILATKLYDLQTQQEQADQDAQRKSQIKSGDRSDKIRTYNFQQSRVTDHRIKHSWYNIEGIMNGEIDDVINTLQQELR